jgi:hypothetical protein
MPRPVPANLVTRVPSDAARPVLAGCPLPLIAALLLVACGATATGRISAPRSHRVARWVAFAHLPRPLDVVTGDAGQRIVVAADARLWLLGAAGAAEPFAQGPNGYRSPGGEEPYVALAPGGCYGTGSVYALRLVAGRGVVAIAIDGQARRVATIGAPGLIDGIAFDTTGAFEHRLLVTINQGSRTAVDAIDCAGSVHTITRTAPRVEGGIAVAPATFGRFAGDLIASNENDGRIYAISPQGTTHLVADSGLPRGGDIGVESEAFIPAGRRLDALLADRLTPGNAHPGDDVVLRIRADALGAAAARPGDLLVATEGGALTDAISCTATDCRVRLVAVGPAIAHAEGHIAFAQTH